MFEYITLMETVRDVLLNDIAKELSDLDKLIEKLVIKYAKSKTLEEKANCRKEIDFLCEKRGVLRHTFFSREDVINSEIDRRIEYHTNLNIEQTG